MQATGSTALHRNAYQPIERSYRLIDGSCLPHCQLDSHYSSIDDAIADAITWIGDVSEPDHPASLIGVEVSSSNGDWRICRVPGPLLCPLLCPLPC
jgi:hypothetical protein